MQRIIGIDFGTSTTYMNIKRYNGAQPDGDKFSYIPVMFNYGESSGYVATIVRENADGSFDFGEKASEPLEGSKIHTEIKMRLESSDEQERAEARRITREFFKFLHAQYVQQTANLGGAGDQEETVVSYPVKWKKETAQFMLDAARDAGFQNVRGMDEAEAAVATVLCQNSGGTGLIYADKPGYLMLIDMGAGTTDLVVCRYQASANGEIAIELVTSWPHSADEPTFGGREIDKVLEQYVEDHLTKSLLPALAPQASVIATAPGQAKMWKERNVSVTLAVDKTVNTCAYIGTYKTMGMLTGDFPAFGRREFESFAESGLRDYARLISGCLEKTAEADEKFSALDLVILTGGHSAWYFAKEILTGAMEGWLDHPALAAVRENFSRVVSLPNPQTTVSLGLVYSKLPFKLGKHEEPKAETKPVEPGATYHDVQLQKEEDGQKVKLAQAAAQYIWDDRFLSIVKQFIQQDPNIRSRNQIHKYPDHQKLWSQIERGRLDFEIYCVIEPGNNAKHIICSDGLYVNHYQGVLGYSYGPNLGIVSWDAFLNGNLDDPNSFEGKIVQKKFGLGGSLCKLQAILREEASKKSKEMSKQSTAQAFQTVENESLDAAMKRFNRQVKDTQRQQKAPVKPAQPTTRTPDRRYKWDDRLLPIIKHHIQTTDLIRRRNEISHTGRANALRKAMNIPAHAELYYVLDWSDNIFMMGREGDIYCSTGIYCRAKNGVISFSTDGLSWDRFMNSEVEEENVWCKIGGMHFNKEEKMDELQKMLREKSVALEEGRPI